MNKLFIILTMLFSVFISGCQDCGIFNTFPEVTAKDEYELLKANCRSFILNSKDIVLSDNEREIINNKEPEFGCRYKVDKYGQYVLKWELSENKTISVTGLGSLLEKSSIKKIRIKDKSVKR